MNLLCQKEDNDVFRTYGINDVCQLREFGK